jgi:hypothetical protein
MSERLGSVQDYLDEVRTLLLDKIQPYRYEDDELIAALNSALLEGRRVRADLFVTKYGNDVPSFLAPSGERVPIEPQFRLAFVYCIAAQALLRDDEDVQDARSTTFMGLFNKMLTGERPMPIQGGTPGPGSATK